MPTQTTKITSAQLLALKTTPVQLNLRTGEVVGPNQFLVLHRASLKYDPGTSQYTITGAAQLNIQYNNTGANQPCSDTCNAAGLIDQSMPGYAHLRGVGCVLPLGVATFYLATNAANAFTVGTGTMSVAIEYSVQG